jgi:hypothetical protein
VSAMLLVNAIASIIGGQPGDGVGVGAGVLGGRGWVIDGVAALAPLNCRAAPAIPPIVIPTTAAAILMVFIVERTTRHRCEAIRSWAIFSPA